MMIYPVIDVFITNEVISHLLMFDHSINFLGKIGLCSEFSKTSHDDSLDNFGKSVVDRVRLEISLLMKEKNSKGKKLKLKIHVN